jgi:ferritin-like protein
MTIGYHEQGISENAADLHRGLSSLQEEIEAIDWYNQRIDVTKDKSLAEILIHNRDEEMEHASMTLEWLRRKSPEFAERLKTYLFLPSNVSPIDIELEEEAHADAKKRSGASGCGCCAQPIQDLLRRHLAPITEKAWKALEVETERTLNGHRSGRKLVGVSGPHGWEHSCVNLGAVDMQPQPQDGVHWGLRQVTPLIEIKVPFALSLRDLDNVERGSQRPDLSALHQAAHTAACFEENLIYHGLPGARMKGLLSASPHPPIAATKNPDTFVSAVEEGILALQKAGVGAPYAVVLGSDYFAMVNAGDRNGIPLVKRISLLAEKGIFWSPVLPIGAVVSTRGGDSEFTIGEDLAIGFDRVQDDAVHLHFIGSFAFNVLEPAAAAAFKQT